MSNTNLVQDNPLSLVWLRRDLRLHGHAAFSKALEEAGKIQPVFVFDNDVLSRFSNKKDRRLTFIAQALWKIHITLVEKNAGVLILHGRAQEIIPKLSSALGATSVVCAEDFEPETRKRDEHVKQSLACMHKEFISVLDHLVFSPRDVMKSDGSPYLVFTPYRKAWHSKLHPYSFEEKRVRLDAERLASFAAITQKAHDEGLPVISMDGGVEALLAAIGYEYNPLEIWAVDNGRKRLESFITTRISNYSNTRDYVAQDGTSMLSPYLRHGLVSIREVMRLAVEQQNPDTWISELIWREFYAMVLYHFPESAHSELQAKYRNIKWLDEEEYWQAFVECRTGYPIVDAAMRQLHEIGWMHNRARMIVASFLTKDLHLDWRRGEEHFAQWLMDYELASNVGGWQWASSTGTDAAPYFRIFNPATQSERFDPQGDYIRKWLPELKGLKGKEVHMPTGLLRPKEYPAPIVDHGRERLIALEMFKRIKF